MSKQLVCFMLGAACLILLLSAASASEATSSGQVNVPGDTNEDNEVSDDELKAAEESYKKGEISSEELDKIRHIKENYLHTPLDGGRRSAEDD